MIQTIRNLRGMELALSTIIVLILLLMLLVVLATFFFTSAETTLGPLTGLARNSTNAVPDPGDLF